MRWNCTYVNYIATKLNEVVVNDNVAMNGGAVAQVGRDRDPTHDKSFANMSNMTSLLFAHENWWVSEVNEM